MNKNSIPTVFPCHGIGGASGSPVGNGGGLERKEHLLRLEVRSCSRQSSNR